MNRLATLEAARVRVDPANPGAPEGRAMLEAAQAEMLGLYRPEEIFSLTADAAASAPNVIFLLARMGRRPVGCVVLLDALHHGVIHRLYVSPDARGLGAGRRLVAALEDHARDIGLRVLRLETGALLAPAVALYRAMGYVDGAPFGDHRTSADSLFLEKRLG